MLGVLAKVRFIYQEIIILIMSIRGLTMNNGKVSLVIILGILVMVLSSGISSAVQKEAHPQAISGNTNISNSYINIVVDPRGDYTMGTTGGNPATGTDDNQKLLFGYPTSFSSYLTVRIDDINY